MIIRDRAPQLLAHLSINPLKEPTATDTKKNDNNKNVSRLTASETQRNIGSVTFFLDAKQFEENLRTKSFSTTEMWLPIRDITVAPNARLSVSDRRLKRRGCKALHDKSDFLRFDSKQFICNNLNGPYRKHFVKKKPNCVGLK